MDGITWHSVTKWGRKWCGEWGYPRVIVFYPRVSVFYPRPPKNNGPPINKKRAAPRAARLSTHIKEQHFSSQYPLNH